jgi:hypothetical protein
LLGNRKKIAKFLMRTFICRSTFLYGEKSGKYFCNYFLEEHRGTCPFLLS